MNGDFSRFKTQDRIKSPDPASTPNRYTSKRPLQTDPKVKTNDRFSQVFNVLLNYWEIKPTQYEAKLHELALGGVKTVSAFVPWAHLETDIFHSLKKFVRAAWTVKLNVRLFVMPELGVNYPNAGFPKDLLANVSNLAVDRVGRVIYNCSAPNIFPLPSFSSPEVLKRFGNYLIKLGSILGEVFNETGTSSYCEIVVSNALFNYYRTHGLKLAEHGDYSAAQVMAFRDFLDREYRASNAQPAAPTAPSESADEPAESREESAFSGAAGLERSNEIFKMQLYEGYNRHRFFTHVERLLREKTDMVFARKSTSCAVRHIDLFNPECAPETAYEGLLGEVFDFRPSVESYYKSIVAGGYRGEAIFLGGSGVFRRFSDQEKSFLMLAALIHSGEVATMVEDLFKLSPAFHRKLRSLVDFLEERRLSRSSRVTFVSASKFSMEESSFELFSRMASGVLSVVGGLDTHARQHAERLIYMDPRSVIRLVEFVQLLSLAQSGKVVAIPAPMRVVANYTADAAGYFEKFKKGRHALKLNIGIPYEVYEYHLGHVVFYDPQSFWTTGEKQGLALFFQALLGLAEVQALCSTSDPRVEISSYVSEEDPSLRLLFVINPTAQVIDTTLAFREIVTIAGLPATGFAEGAGTPLVGKSFELSVPPLGILSMQLSEPSQDELQSIASETAGLAGEPGAVRADVARGNPADRMTRWT